MNPIRGICSLLLAAPLMHAAWTFETISNATEGHMASRVVLNGERTLVAYHNANTLMAATSNGGALVPETVLNFANPSKIFASVGTRGAGLISYWNGSVFRFALQVTPGAGNCGPSANWACGSVKLPNNTLTQVADTIVGQADALGNSYFIYRLRTTNGVNNGVFYTKRTPAGTWTTPLKINLTEIDGMSPVAIELVSESSIRFLAAGNNGAATVSGNAGTFSAIFGQLPASNITSADMQKSTGPTHFCFTNASLNVRMVHRSPNTGQWQGIQNANETGETVRPHCSIQMLAANVPVIAYTSTADVVRLWRNGIWETVDASGVFSKPIIDLTPANKLLILYQGAGFLKFGREQ